MAIPKISGPQARRALRGQQLTTGASIDPVSNLQALGAVQLDGLQRVAFAHRLTLLARAAESQPAAGIDTTLWPQDDQAASVVFDSPAHAACLVAIDQWPDWQHRRADELLRRPSYPHEQIQRIIERVTTEGPLTLAELEAGTRTTRGWDWSPVKRTAEHLVRAGELVVCRRRGARRVFDAPSRHIRAEVRERVLSRSQAMGRLVERAVRACGVASEKDIAEYFRLSPADVQRGLDTSVVQPCEVDGWRDENYIHPDDLDDIPRLTGMAHRVLIGPFDNLIWDRARTKRLFDFDYTFEAYKPAAKRTYGAYVMAVLSDDSLCARVDLARNGTQLVAHNVYFEQRASTSTRQTTEHAIDRLQRQLTIGAP